MIRHLLEMLRLMVGVPDYERYLAHRRTHHPELPLPTHAEFILERQKARYDGRSQNRCC